MTTERTHLIICIIGLGKCSRFFFSFVMRRSPVEATKKKNKIYKIINLQAVSAEKKINNIDDDDDDNA